MALKLLLNTLLAEKLQNLENTHTWLFWVMMSVEGRLNTLVVDLYLTINMFSLQPIALINLMFRKFRLYPLGSFITFICSFHLLMLG